MNKLKTIGLLLLASFFIFSCSKNDPKKPKDSDGFDMAKLLTAEMVRRTFDVHDSIALEPSFGVLSPIDNYIEYKWNAMEADGKRYYYTVDLNFYSSTPSTTSGLDAMWESQNEGIYKDKEMELVSGVGRKASWSTLAGGQLRVISDKYLFYFTLRGAGGGDKGWSKDYRIEKGGELAEEIIAKL